METKASNQSGKMNNNLGQYRLRMIPVIKTRGEFVFPNSP